MLFRSILNLFSLQIIVLWWLYLPIETLHGELIRSFSGLFRALCALHVAINFWNINSLTMSMFDLAAFIDWKNILTKYVNENRSPKAHCTDASPVQLWFVPYCSGYTAHSNLSQVSVIATVCP